MTRILTAALLLAPLAFGAATPVVAAERRYTVTDFDRVQIDGPFEVVLTTGDASAAVARGDQRALDALDIDVQGRLLKIRASLSKWGGYPGERSAPAPVIELTTREIVSIFLRGPGSLTVDRARGMRFDVSQSGGGRIDVGSIDADRLTLTQIGAGTVAIGGKAKIVRAAVQGAAALDAKALVAEDAQIEAGTAGDVTMTIRRSAKINSSGAGDVVIEGDPACTVTVRGRGRVLCGD